MRATLMNLVQLALAVTTCHVACIALPRATAAAPQLLHLTEGILENGSTDTGAPGTLIVRATVDDSAGDGTLATRLLSHAVTVAVRDGRAFNVGVPLSDCRRVGSDIRCDSDSARLRLKRTSAPFGYSLRLSVRHLPGSATGSTRPITPVRVAIDMADGQDRVDVISDCIALGDRRLVCRDTGRPNIVFIVTDDQRWDTVRYMPHTIELLANQGMTFGNAFVTTPLCAPSRASMLTGQYAHRHGVLTNVNRDSGAAALARIDASTLATWLHDAGYRTGMIGKYMVGYADQCPPYRPTCRIPPGWDDWHVFLAQGYFDYTLSENAALRSYGKAASDYSTDVLTEKAVDFIMHGDGRPFFLHLAYAAPHMGAIVPEPAPRHAGTFRGKPAAVPPTLPPWRPPSYDEEDVRDKAPWMALLPRAETMLGKLPAGPFGETTRLLQLETLLAVDDGIAAIVAALDSTGQRENTVVVFTSDNGFFWGEHRLFRGKDYPYLEALRIPLLVRYPRLIAEARTDPALVLNIDLAPTLADLAHAPHNAAVDGLSFAPIIRQQRDRIRDDFLFEWFGFHNEDLKDYVGVVSPEWQLITYPGTAAPELYDLVHDPYEMESRAADPAYRRTLSELQSRLIALSQK